MLDTDADNLAQLVKSAVTWTPKDEPNKIGEKLSKEDFTHHPVTVTKCCRECVFLNPNDTCENFKSPKKLPKHKPGEWIPIPRQLAELIFCEAWIEHELGKLILMGYTAGGIAYGRRHPNVVTPNNGLQDFAKHLKSLSRQQLSWQPETSGGSEDTKWPIMDVRLKTILVNVERKGSQEMWSQYQGNLLSMDFVSYIDSIFDRLLQKPNSQIGAFFKYVIETHGYFYRGKFGEAGERGARTYERILGLLKHQSETVRDIAIGLLMAISRRSYGKKPPEGSIDQNGWREWAKDEFRYDWEKG